jgi:cyclase
VASIDARLVGARRWDCFSHAGTFSTGRDVVSWAREVADRGAETSLLPR